VDTPTLAQIHRAINVIISEICPRGQADDLLRRGAPVSIHRACPAVPACHATCTTVLAGPEAGACQKADSRDYQDVDALSRSAHTCAAAARRLACKHQPRAQASAGSGEIRVHSSRATPTLTAASLQDSGLAPDRGQLCQDRYRRGRTAVRPRARDEGARYPGGDLTASGDDLTDGSDPSRVMMRQMAGSFAQYNPAGGQAAGCS
jgi:hypothetical protein